MVSLPPLGRQITRESYTQDEIKKMQNRGSVEVVRLPYRIDLSTKYTDGRIEIEERVSLDPKTLLPWLGSKVFRNVKGGTKQDIYNSINMMREDSRGEVFGNSYEYAFDSPVVLTALSTTGEGLTKDAVKFFKELEALISVLND